MSANSAFSGRRAVNCRQKYKPLQNSWWKICFVPDGRRFGLGGCWEQRDRIAKMARSKKNLAKTHPAGILGPTKIE
jgi:hypothetical protein